MDTKLFRAIQCLSGRCFLIDQLMILLSKKARLAFFFLLLLKWLLSGPKRKTVYSALFSAGAAFMLDAAIRCFYFKPRPFMKHKVGILMPVKVNSSFPSKHTLLAFAVSTAVFLRDQAWGRILSFIAGITGLSRVWVGHHYPSDIVFSAMIGTATGFIVHQSCSYQHNEETDS
ncbi:phosphatase PAP2 family protein [Bacillus xiapuensis]|uniref:phosphatase PAP2 family protein n=1 Tax=Bacillus xiapuensis TaxID=2014075 RepID=UPI000C2309F7|nr:phosphatase PAP2 family protein [Bacillus xiapuensis]